MALLIEYPWLASIVALVFAALWGWKRAPGAGLTALCWAGYCVYEFLMRARMLCSGECNIRVDLLLIYPFLLLVSLLPIWRSFRSARNR